MNFVKLTFVFTMIVGVFSNINVVVNDKFLKTPQWVADLCDFYDHHRKVTPIIRPNTTAKPFQSRMRDIE